MGIRIIIAILILAGIAITDANAQLYVYTDKKGNTVYTDKPPQNMESKPKNLREDGVYYSSPREASQAASADNAAPGGKRKPAEQSRKNYNRVNVVMYMTGW